MRLVVVDDEPDVQLLYRLSFRSEIKKGLVSIDFFNSAEEALTFLEQHDPHEFSIVLSDINMPEMDGLELLQKVKSNYADLKVFMVTAYGKDVHFSRASSLGCDGYFTKPIDFDSLKTDLFSN
ncbi:MAG: response regulator [Calditrichia bacterium]